MAGRVIRGGAMRDVANQTRPGLANVALGSFLGFCVRGGSGDPFSSPVCAVFPIPRSGKMREPNIHPDDSSPPLEALGIHLSPRSTLSLELRWSKNQGAQQVVGVGRGQKIGGARSSHGHRFRPPNLTICAFMKARHMSDSKRGTGQCTHGHQLEYHIPTARMYQYRELKGTQPWGCCVTKVPKWI